MLLVDGQPARYADENTAPPAVAELVVDGASSGSLIIVDTVYNYGPDPEPFTLTITRANTSAPSAP
jgi:hypothetical protein